MSWNIVLVGESGVGKTSMVQRYVSNRFVKFRSTVVVDQFFKEIEMEGRRVKLVIWDSAGQEIFRSIVPQYEPYSNTLSKHFKRPFFYVRTLSKYFRKADGCILVYDVTDITTFHKLSSWLSEFRAFNERAPVIIAGNKNEEVSKKSVGVSVVKSFAQQEDMECVECSAMSGENVNAAFELLINKLWETRTRVNEDESPNERKTNTEEIVWNNVANNSAKKKAYKNPENKSITLSSTPPLTMVKKKKGCC